MKSLNFIITIATMVPPLWAKAQGNEKISLLPTASRPNNIEESSTRELFEQLATELKTIEQEINKGDPARAMTLAKESLDKVRARTGIDPKAKLRENILVQLPSTKPGQQIKFSDLPERDQELIIRTLSSNRGGMYLDLLNLAKRTTLLHIKAFHRIIQKNGGMTNEDRTKILKDLASIGNSPISLEDQHGNKFIVYDNQVANPDQIYMFNREIKVYVISSQDLAISEENFDKYKDELMGGGKSSKQEIESCTDAFIGALKNVVWYLGGTNLKLIEKVTNICAHKIDTPCLTRQSQRIGKSLHDADSAISTLLTLHTYHCE